MKSIPGRWKVRANTSGTYDVYRLRNILKPYQIGNIVIYDTYIEFSAAEEAARILNEAAGGMS